MKIVPVLTRSYSLTTSVLPVSSYKGKQRQIVVQTLLDSKIPMTPEQMVGPCTEKGLTAVGGILPSIRYHLHHLTLLGHTVWSSPEVETVKNVA